METVLGHECRWHSKRRLTLEQHAPAAAVAVQDINNQRVELFKHAMACFILMASGFALQVQQQSLPAAALGAQDLHLHRNSRYNTSTNTPRMRY